MFRDGDYVYKVSNGCTTNHDTTFHRKSKKDCYIGDASEIKKEINKLKISIRNKEKLLDYAIKHNNTDGANTLTSILEKAKEDLNFWLNEMSKINNEPHKSLKSKTKRIKEEKLKKLVIEKINEATSNDINFIRMEDVAFSLNVKVKYLSKIFMDLNKEGILSQPTHNFMHDSNREYRYGEHLEPDERSDWSADVYHIN